MFHVFISECGDRCLCRPRFCDHNDPPPHVEGSCGCGTHATLHPIARHSGRGDLLGYDDRYRSDISRTPYVGTQKPVSASATFQHVGNLFTGQSFHARSEYCTPLIRQRGELDRCGVGVRSHCGHRRSWCEQGNRAWSRAYASSAGRFVLACRVGYTTVDVFSNAVGMDLTFRLYRCSQHPIHTGSVDNS